MQIEKFVGFYADGASVGNTVDFSDVKLPAGWTALIKVWQDNGQRELRCYCPNHAEQHRGEGREL